jgi:hypothetical protein
VIGSPRETFLGTLGVSNTHIYLLSELGEFPEGGRTGGLRSSDWGQFFHLQPGDLLIMS